MMYDVPPQNFSSYTPIAKWRFYLAALSLISAVLFFILLSIFTLVTEGQDDYNLAVYFLAGFAIILFVLTACSTLCTIIVGLIIEQISHLTARTSNLISLCIVYLAASILSIICLDWAAGSITAAALLILYLLPGIIGLYTITKPAKQPMKEQQHS